MDRGELLNAKHYFSIAANMIPTRVSPKYYLWKVAVREQNYSEALLIADTILSQKIKVKSSKTLEMQNEIYVWRKKYIFSILIPIIWAISSCTTPKGHAIKYNIEKLTIPIEGKYNSSILSISDSCWILACNSGKKHFHLLYTNDFGKSWQITQKEYGTAPSIIKNRDEILIIAKEKGQKLNISTRIYSFNPQSKTISLFKTIENLAIIQVACGKKNQYYCTSFNIETGDRYLQSMNTKDSTITILDSGFEHKICSIGDELVHIEGAQYLKTNFVFHESHNLIQINESSSYDIQTSSNVIALSAKTASFWEYNEKKLKKLFTFKSPDGETHIQYLYSGTNSNFFQTSIFNKKQQTKDIYISSPNFKHISRVNDNGGHLFEDKFQNMHISANDTSLLISAFGSTTLYHIQLQPENQHTEIK